MMGSCTTPLQQQLDLSSNRLRVELRLELRMAPNQSSKLERLKNYKIVFYRNAKNTHYNFSLKLATTSER